MLMRTSRFKRVKNMASWTAGLGTDIPASCMVFRVREGLLMAGVSACCVIVILWPVCLLQDCG